MIKFPIPMKYGPPEVRHRITGEISGDLPVGSIEVLIHRQVTLSEWTLVKASPTQWVLYWPLSTGGSILHDGVRTLLRPGRLYLIPPNTSIDTHARKRFSKWFVHFTLRGVTLPPTHGVYESVPTRRMRTLLDQVCPRNAFPGTTPPHGCQWLLIELIALALEHAPERLWLAFQDDPRLNTALEILNRDFAAKLTIDSLSKAVGLGPRGLTKLFVQRTGFPPMRYLTELRLNHCCRLLRHSALPIEDIAEHCGFANRFYLSRMMKKYRYATPAFYRAQARPV